MIVLLRRLLFRLGFKKTYYSPIPVIVVGNITVGGCGKTPCVRALYHLLLSKGFKPAIISRGYGGTAASYPLYVTPTSNVSETGDEPLMLAKSGCRPFVVSPMRVAAIRKLVADENCDIIISDDGMQHYAMYRDIECALFDAKQRVGNGFMLPAGPLREPVSRLRAVDYVLFKGALPNNLRYPDKSYAMQIRPEGFFRVNDFSVAVEPQQLSGKVVALAAIARPESFKQQLLDLGLDCELISFPDHHRFSAQDIDIKADWVIMTEKDAVKCEAFCDDRHVFLAISLHFEDKFSDSLIKNIQNKL